MRRSRILTAVAVVSVAAALSACGSASGGGDPNVLTVAATSNEKPALDAIVPKFEAANPGIKVQVTTSGIDQYQTTIRTQLSSGTAPDVVYVWPGDGNPIAMKVAAKAGYLEDLSAKPWAANIPAGIRSVTQLEGKTWIAPVTFSGIGAVYNTGALQAAGLTAPTTWTELMTFCSAAKAKGKTAFALGGQTNWVTQLIDYALTPTLVYGPNPDFAQQMSQGQAKFASSPWSDAMTKYLQMQQAGCFQDNPLGTDYESSLGMVSKGQALGVVQVTSAISALEQLAPDVKYSMLPLPATDDAAATRMAGAAGAAYGINAKAKNKNLAEKFLDYLMSPEGTNLYVQTNAGLPAIPNDAYQADPAVITLQQFQQDGKTDPFMDQLWPNARVQQTHFTVVQDLLAGKTTVPDALTKMDESYGQGS